MKAESTKKIRLLTQEERLESLVNDYTTRKQPSLIQMKKGIQKESEESVIWRKI